MWISILCCGAASFAMGFSLKMWSCICAMKLPLKRWSCILCREALLESGGSIFVMRSSVWACSIACHCIACICSTLSSLLLGSHNKLLPFGRFHFHFLMDRMLLQEGYLEIPQSLPSKILLLTLIVVVQERRRTHSTSLCNMELSPPHRSSAPRTWRRYVRMFQGRPHGIRYHMQLGLRLA